MTNPVLFFDGVCNLCNAAVDWVVRHDKRGVHRFAPLQGDTADATLAPEHRDLDTVVLWDGARPWVRSDAALRVLIGIGGAWAVLGRAGLIVPRPLRDAVYRFVAKNRYRWFGQKDSCRLPTPAERKLFLP